MSLILSFKEGVLLIRGSCILLMRTGNNFSGRICGMVVPLKNKISEIIFHIRVITPQLWTDLKIPMGLPNCGLLPNLFIHIVCFEGPFKKDVI